MSADEKLARLQQSLRYVIEDMLIHAGQLERDRWFPVETLEREVEKNAFAARLLRTRASWLERYLKESET